MSGYISPFEQGEILTKQRVAKIKKLERRNAQLERRAKILLNGVKSLRIIGNTAGRANKTYRDEIRETQESYGRANLSLLDELRTTKERHKWADERRLQAEKDAIKIRKNRDTAQSDVETMRGLRDEANLKVEVARIELDGQCELTDLHSRKRAELDLRLREMRERLKVARIELAESKPVLVKAHATARALLEVISGCGGECIKTVESWNDF